MKDVGAEIKRSLKSMIFVLFFCLALSALSGKPVIHKQVARIAVVSQINDHHAQATAVDFLQVPSFQKNMLSVSDKQNFRLSDNAIQLLSYNNTESQKIAFLSEYQLSVKPLQFCIFYFNHLYPKGSDKVSILS